MTKEEYLEKYIFIGLTNLNTGFDAYSIQYFSEVDFATILERIEKLGLGIYGVEPFLDSEYFDTKVYEEYTSLSTDPMWFNKAFNEFKEINKELIYSASYHIPEEFLKSNKDSEGA